MQHLRARADGAPHHVARVPVHGDQTWGARRWNARVTFIQAVGGRDDQQITHGHHVAASRLMRKDTQAAAHVQLPDDVGSSVVLEDFILIRAVVRAITETLRVETSQLALGGDVVQPVSFHVRRACRRRQQKLSQTSLDSRSHVLPEELAILRLKCHEHAGVFLESGVHVPGVVGAHIDRIATNHGTTVRFVSERDTPDDVPTGLRIPVNRRIARLHDCRLER